VGYLKYQPEGFEVHWQVSGQMKPLFMVPHIIEHTYESLDSSLAL
jgi:hypothetical protein